MWTAKFKFRHEGSPTIPYMKKYNLTMLAFPLNTYFEGENVFITSSHIVLGSEENQKKYFKAIRGDKRISNIEINENNIVYTLKSKKTDTHLQMYFSPKIFLVKPIAVKPDGWQYIELASWDKNNLSDLIKKIEVFGELHNLNIAKGPLTDLYIPHLSPVMTKKQKEAIMFAYRHGYYSFPKKTNIERIAKLMKVSPSTLQEHLRKAEEKIMPFVLENMTEKQA